MDKKTSIISVQGVNIAVTNINQEDYISLTDMIRAKDGDFVISDWLRNRDTIEFIGTWESIYNQNFNYGEFTIIRNESGSRAYRISIKDWTERTNAIGIIARTGRYGGTYAHKDIAFNFGMWISPVFQLYIVKEYQRLKEIETNQYNLEWNIKRILSKVNYQIHTDSIKNYIIPKLTFSQKKELVYADEADMLNIVLFGCTAKQWRDANPQRVLNGENIRDMASINELAILSNMENLNSSLIKQGIDRRERARFLYNAVIEQKKILENIDMLRSIKKLSKNTYVDMQSKVNEFPDNTNFKKIDNT